MLVCVLITFLFSISSEIVETKTVVPDDDGLKPNLSCILYGDEGCKRKCELLCETYKCISSAPACRVIFCDCHERVPTKNMGIKSDGAGITVLPPDITFRELIAVKFMRTPVFRDLDKVMPTLPELQEEVRQFLYHTDLAGYDLKRELKEKYPQLRYLFRRLRPRPLAQINRASSAEVEQDIEVQQPANSYGWWFTSNTPSPKKLEADTPENEKRIIELIKRIDNKQDLLDTFYLLKDSNKKPLYKRICKYFLKEGLSLPDGTEIIKPTENHDEIAQKVEDGHIVNNIQDKINESKNQKNKSDSNESNSEENSNKIPKLSDQPMTIHDSGWKPSFWGSGSYPQTSQEHEANPTKNEDSAQYPFKSQNYGSSWSWPSWGSSTHPNQQNPQTDASPDQTSIVPVPSIMPTNYDARSIDSGEISPQKIQSSPSKKKKKKKRKKKKKHKKPKRMKREKLRTVKQMKPFEGDLFSSIEWNENTPAISKKPFIKDSTQNPPPRHIRKRKMQMKEAPDLWKSNVNPTMKRKKHRVKPPKSMNDNESESDESSQNETPFPPISHKRLKKSKSKKDSTKIPDSFEDSSDESKKAEKSKRLKKPKKLRKTSKNAAPESSQESSEESEETRTPIKRKKKSKQRPKVSNDFSPNSSIPTNLLPILGVGSAAMSQNADGFPVSMPINEAELSNPKVNEIPQRNVGSESEEDSSSEEADNYQHIPTPDEMNLLSPITASSTENGLMSDDKQNSNMPLPDDSPKSTPYSWMMPSNLLQQNISPPSSIPSESSWMPMSESFDTSYLPSSPFSPNGNNLDSNVHTDDQHAPDASSLLPNTQKMNLSSDPVLWNGIRNPFSATELNNIPGSISSPRDIEDLIKNSNNPESILQALGQGVTPNGLISNPLIDSSTKQMINQAQSPSSLGISDAQNQNEPTIIAQTSVSPDSNGDYTASNTPTSSSSNLYENSSSQEEILNETPLFLSPFGRFADVFNQNKPTVLTSTSVPPHLRKDLVASNAPPSSLSNLLNDSSSEEVINQMPSASSPFDKFTNIFDQNKPSNTGPISILPNSNGDHDALNTPTLISSSFVKDSSSQEEILNQTPLVSSSFAPSFTTSTSTIPQSREELVSNTPLSNLNNALNDSSSQEMIDQIPSASSPFGRFTNLFDQNKPLWPTLISPKPSDNLIISNVPLHNSNNLSEDSASQDEVMNKKPPVAPRFGKLADVFDQSEPFTIASKSISPDSSVQEDQDDQNMFINQPSSLSSFTDMPRNPFSQYMNTDSNTSVPSSEENDSSIPTRFSTTQDKLQKITPNSPTLSIMNKLGLPVTSSTNDKSPTLSKNPSNASLSIMNNERGSPKESQENNDSSENSTILPSMMMKNSRDLPKGEQESDEYSSSNLLSLPETAPKVNNPEEAIYKDDNSAPSSFSWSSMFYPSKLKALPDDELNSAIKMDTITNKPNSTESPESAFTISNSPLVSPTNTLPLTLTQDLTKTPTQLSQLSSSSSQPDYISLIPSNLQNLNNMNDPVVLSGEFLHQKTPNGESLENISSQTPVTLMDQLRSKLNEKNSPNDLSNDSLSHITSNNIRGGDTSKDNTSSEESSLEKLDSFTPITQLNNDLSSFTTNSLFPDSLDSNTDNNYTPLLSLKNTLSDPTSALADNVNDDPLANLQQNDILETKSNDNSSPNSIFSPVSTDQLGDTPSDESGAIIPLTLADESNESSFRTTSFPRDIASSASIENDYPYELNDQSPDNSYAKDTTSTTDDPLLLSNTQKPKSRTDVSSHDMPIPKLPPIIPSADGKLIIPKPSEISAPSILLNIPPDLLPEDMRINNDKNLPLLDTTDDSAPQRYIDNNHFSGSIPNENISIDPITGDISTDLSHFKEPSHMESAISNTSDSSQSEDSEDPLKLLNTNEDLSKQTSLSNTNEMFNNELPDNLSSSEEKEILSALKSTNPTNTMLNNLPDNSMKNLLIPNNASKGDTISNGLPVEPSTSSSYLNTPQLGISSDMKLNGSPDGMSVPSSSNLGSPSMPSTTRDILTNYEQESIIKQQGIPNFNSERIKPISANVVPPSNSLLDAENDSSISSMPTSTGNKILNKDILNLLESEFSNENSSPLELDNLNFSTSTYDSDTKNSFPIKSISSSLIDSPSPLLQKGMKTNIDSLQPILNDQNSSASVEDTNSNEVPPINSPSTPNSSTSSLLFPKGTTILSSDPQGINSNNNYLSPPSLTSSRNTPILGEIHNSHSDELYSNEDQLSKNPITTTNGISQTGRPNPELPLSLPFEENYSMSSLLDSSNSLEKPPILQNTDFNDIENSPTNSIPDGRSPSGADKLNYSSEDSDVLSNPVTKHLDDLVINELPSAEKHINAQPALAINGFPSETRSISDEGNLATPNNFANDLSDLSNESHSDSNTLLPKLRDNMQPSSNVFPPEDVIINSSNSPLSSITNPIPLTSKETSDFLTTQNAEEIPLDDSPNDKNVMKITSAGKPQSESNNLSTPVIFDENGNFKKLTNSNSDLNPLNNSSDEINVYPTDDRDRNIPMSPEKLNRLSNPIKLDNLGSTINPKTSSTEFKTPTTMNPLLGDSSESPESQINDELQQIINEEFSMPTSDNNNDLNNADQFVNTSPHEGNSNLASTFNPNMLNKNQSQEPRDMQKITFPDDNEFSINSNISLESDSLESLENSDTTISGTGFSISGNIPASTLNIPSANNFRDISSPPLSSKNSNATKSSSSENNLPSNKFPTSELSNRNSMNQNHPSSDHASQSNSNHSSFDITPSNSEELTNTSNSVIPNSSSPDSEEMSTISLSSKIPSSLSSLASRPSSSNENSSASTPLSNQPLILNSNDDLPIERSLSNTNEPNSLDTRNSSNLVSDLPKQATTPTLYDNEDELKNSRSDEPPTQVGSSSSKVPNSLISPSSIKSMDNVKPSTTFSSILNNLDDEDDEDYVLDEEDYILDDYEEYEGDFDDFDDSAEFLNQRPQTFFSSLGNPSNEPFPDQKLSLSIPNTNASPMFSFSNPSSLQSPSSSLEKLSNDPLSELSHSINDEQLPKFDDEANKSSSLLPVLASPSTGTPNIPSIPIISKGTTRISSPSSTNLFNSPLSDDSSSFPSELGLQLDSQPPISSNKSGNLQSIPPNPTLKTPITSLNAPSSTIPQLDSLSSPQDTMKSTNPPTLTTSQKIQPPVTSPPLFPSKDRSSTPTAPTTISNSSSTPKLPIQTSPEVFDDAEDEYDEQTPSLLNPSTPILPNSSPTISQLDSSSSPQDTMKSTNPPTLTTSQKLQPPVTSPPLFPSKDRSSTPTAPTTISNSSSTPKLPNQTSPEVFDDAEDEYDEQTPSLSNPSTPISPNSSSTISQLDSLSSPQDIMKSTNPPTLATSQKIQPPVTSPPLFPLKDRSLTPSTPTTISNSSSTPKLPIQTSPEVFDDAEDEYDEQTPPLSNPSTPISLNSSPTISQLDSSSSPQDIMKSTNPPTLTTSQKLQPPVTSPPLFPSKDRSSTPTAPTTISNSSSTPKLPIQTSPEVFDDAEDEYDEQTSSLPNLSPPMSPNPPSNLPFFSSTPTVKPSKIFTSEEPLETISDDDIDTSSPNASIQTPIPSSNISNSSPTATPSARQPPVETTTPSTTREPEASNADENTVPSSPSSKPSSNATPKPPLKRPSLFTSEELPDTVGSEEDTPTGESDASNCDENTVPSSPSSKPSSNSTPKPPLKRPTLFTSEELPDTVRSEEDIENDTEDEIADASPKPPPLPLFLKPKPPTIITPPPRKPLNLSSPLNNFTKPPPWTAPQNNALPNKPKNFSLNWRQKLLQKQPSHIP